MTNINILFEDQDLAVIVKPAGVVVNNADTVSEETLQDWWMKRLANEEVLSEKEWQGLVPADFPHEYGSPEETFQLRGGIVHRLDKETSGVMVLAKNPGSLAQLLKQFRTREVHKQYVCLVHGKFSVPEDTLSLPLGRAAFNRTKFTVVPDGRPAETKYQVQQFYDGFVHMDFVPPGKNAKKKMQSLYQGFSLVYCWPKTGRTHQIRVHMAHIKHPIVADETYLGAKRLGFDTLWCPHLFLHAMKLEFAHPRSGEKVVFETELPVELQQTLSLLTPAHS